MTTPVKVHESKLLAEVRRWRREAYEADMARTPEQRAEHLKKLMEQFGLTKKTKGRDSHSPVNSQ